MAIPVQSNDENKNMPINSEIIGKINGIKPLALSSEQVRIIRRMLNGGYTGGILLEAVDGQIIPDGIHRIRFTTFEH
jgi:hypothetical protein